VHIFDRPQPYFSRSSHGPPLHSPDSPPDASWPLRGSPAGSASCSHAAAAGSVLLVLGFWLTRARKLYAVYDFWHSQPEFLPDRIGLVTGILLVGYAWCRWAPSLWDSARC